MFALVCCTLLISFLASEYQHGAIILYTFAHFSDKIKMRSPFILAGLMMCLVGFSISISEASHGVKYFGTFFCVAGAYSAAPGVIAWWLPLLQIVVWWLTFNSAGWGITYLVNISVALG